MRVSPPHFLLFSESRSSRDSRSMDPSDTIGRWRFVLESIDGETVLEATDDESDEDASRLELLAVVRGLEALDQPSRVTLLTPSRYVTHGLRFGLDEWRENDWQWERFGEMQRVKNWDLWQRIDRAMRFHCVDCRVWHFDVAAEGPPASHLSRRSVPSANRLEDIPNSESPGNGLPEAQGVVSACRRLIQELLRRYWLSRPAIEAQAA
jgi:ribonuclease HI